MSKRILDNQRGKTPGAKIVSVVSLMLGIAFVATSVAFFIWRSYSNRMYKERWKDYYDCGLV